MEPIKLFLSHKYKAPEINQYFYDLLSSISDFLFEVDEGVKATSVTRLERKIRLSDAFLGVFSIPQGEERLDYTTSKQQTRYFRLELDIAIRAGIPIAVFADKNLGKAVRVPPSAFIFRFDSREILASGGKRMESNYRELFKRFIQNVRNWVATRNTQPAFSSSFDSDRVGVIVPTASYSGNSYSEQQIHLIENTIENMSLESVTSPFNRGIEEITVADILQVDWIITDIGDAHCKTGIPALLHGLSIPHMRLLNQNVSTKSPFESGIYAPFEVGYPKDILRWRTDKELEDGIMRRISTLYHEPKLLQSNKEAKGYFDKASRKNTVVFVSYSGNDKVFADELIMNLRTEFQEVFDYQDNGESITYGSSWIKALFRKLSRSALGIPIYSEQYFKSGNCEHELETMVAYRDQGKMVVLPILLSKSCELPEYTMNIQYMTPENFSGIPQIVEKIVTSYDKLKENTTFVRIT